MVSISKLNIKRNLSKANSKTAVKVALFVLILLFGLLAFGLLRFGFDFLGRLFQTIVIGLIVGVLSDFITIPFSAVARKKKKS